MASPFPGMDPYLEQPGTWPGFHTTLYVEIMAELNRRLPPGYVARIDRYVWIHEPEAQDRILLGKPDTFVVNTKEDAPMSGVGTVTRAAPATIVLPAVRREGSRFLKIRDVQNKRVVTVLEILSPANKNPNQDR